MLLGSGYPKKGNLILRSNHLTHEAASGSNDQSPDNTTVRPNSSSPDFTTEAFTILQNLSKTPRNHYLYGHSKGDEHWHL